MLTPYPNNPMYLVSERGDVFSLYTGRYLKTPVGKRGYKVFTAVCPLTKRHTKKYVHRCVAETFLDTSDMSWVNHKDGDKLNNNVSNLEWTNDKLNKEHAKKIDLVAHGSDHHNSKLTEEDVHRICHLLSEGFSTGCILKEYPWVSRGTLLNIRARRTWVRVSQEYHWEKCSNKRNRTCRDYRKHS